MCMFFLFINIFKNCVDLMIKNKRGILKNNKVIRKPMEIIER